MNLLVPHTSSSRSPRSFSAKHSFLDFLELCFLFVHPIDPFTKLSVVYDQCLVSEARLSFHQSTLINDLINSWPDCNSQGVHHCLHVLIATLHFNSFYSSCLGFTDQGMFLNFTTFDSQHFNRMVNLSPCPELLHQILVMLSFQLPLIPPSFLVPRLLDGFFPLIGQNISCC